MPPPKTGPIPAARPAAAPTTPKAAARRSTGNTCRTSAAPVGSIIAAVSAWTTRVTSSIVRSVDSAARMLATPKPSIEKR